MERQLNCLRKRWIYVFEIKVWVAGFDLSGLRGWKRIYKRHQQADIIYRNVIFSFDHFWFITLLFDYKFDAPFKKSTQRKRIWIRLISPSCFFHTKQKRIHCIVERHAWQENISRFFLFLVYGTNVFMTGTLNFKALPGSDGLLVELCSTNTHCIFIHIWNTCSHLCRLTNCMPMHLLSYCQEQCVCVCVAFFLCIHIHIQGCK